MSKIVLVTGASQGVGKNAAISLAKAGFQVIATARNKDKLAETVSEGEGQIEAIVSDVTDMFSSTMQVTCFHQ